MDIICKHKYICIYVNTNVYVSIAKPKLVCGLLGIELGFVIERLSKFTSVVAHTVVFVFSGLSLINKC